MLVLESPAPIFCVPLFPLVGTLNPLNLRKQGPASSILHLFNFPVKSMKEIQNKAVASIIRMRL